MAFDSKIVPCGVSSTGTLPVGLNFAAALASTSFTAISTPAYSAAIKALNALKLPG